MSSTKLSRRVPRFTVPWRDLPAHCDVPLPADAAWVEPQPVAPAAQDVVADDDHSEIWYG